jgi:hypothetical protein
MAAWNDFAEILKDPRRSRPYRTFAGAFAMAVALLYLVKFKEDALRWIGGWLLQPHGVVSTAQRTGGKAAPSSAPPVTFSAGGQAVVLAGFYLPLLALSAAFVYSPELRGKTAAVRKEFDEEAESFYAQQADDIFAAAEAREPNSVALKDARFVATVTPEFALVCEERVTIRPAQRPDGTVIPVEYMGITLSGTPAVRGWRALNLSAEGANADGTKIDRRSPESGSHLLVVPGSGLHEREKRLVAVFVPPLHQLTAAVRLRTTWQWPKGARELEDPQRPVPCPIEYKVTDKSLPVDRVHLRVQIEAPGRYRIEVPAENGIRAQLERAPEYTEASGDPGSHKFVDVYYTNVQPGTSLRLNVVRQPGGVAT